MKLTGNGKMGDGTDKVSGVGRAVGTRKRRRTERASALVGERESERWMTERATGEKRKGRDRRKKIVAREREAGKGIKCPGERGEGQESGREWESVAFLMKRETVREKMRESEWGFKWERETKIWILCGGGFEIPSVATLKL
jgi:hypothetical protein